jgi:LCP family protein required for cell wall assembly
VNVDFHRQRDAPRRGFVGRGALLGLKVVAAVLSLATLVGSGFAWGTYRDLTANIKRVHVTRHSAIADRNIDGSAQNILVVGNDDRDTATDAELKELGTTRDDGTLNTDTMMLLHVPADGRKATVISFPRDSYVNIPGLGMAKLNAAYPTGVSRGHGDKGAGASLLEDTVENLTGLKVDSFVQVDLLGFYRISKALDGVSVCLVDGARPASFTGERGDGIDSGWENGVFVPSYTQINLKPGVSKIQGLQALAFVRQRHGLKGGDLDRIKRQQYFLAAVFRQLSDKGTLLNPIKLHKLLKAITSSLTMDETLDPLKLADQFQNLSAGNVTFTTIPLLGDRTVEKVGDVEVVNMAAMPDFIDRLIGNPAADKLQRAKPANPSTVAVVNDTDSNGLEQANAAALAKLGFHTTVPPATSDVLARTTIRYPRGSEPAAKAVQAAVPGAALVLSSSVPGVTLVLGNNGVQVASLMPAHSAATSSAPASGSGSTAPNSEDGTVTTNAAQLGCID